MLTVKISVWVCVFVWDPTSHTHTHTVFRSITFSFVFFSILLLSLVSSFMLCKHPDKLTTIFVKQEHEYWLGLRFDHSRMAILVDFHDPIRYDGPGAMSIINNPSGLRGFLQRLMCPKLGCLRAQADSNCHFKSRFQPQCGCDIWTLY